VTSNFFALFTTKNLLMQCTSGPVTQITTTSLVQSFSIDRLQNLDFLTASKGAVFARFVPHSTHFLMKPSAAGSGRLHAPATDALLSTAFRQPPTFGAPHASPATGSSPASSAPGMLHPGKYRKERTRRRVTEINGILRFHPPGRPLATTNCTAGPGQVYTVEVIRM